MLRSILPSLTNFIALPIKFNNICESFEGSPFIISGMFSEIEILKTTFGFIINVLHK